MGKMIGVFLIVTILLHLSIMGWRFASGKERWELVKTLTYSAGLGIITVVLLSVIVILF